jgi:membrane protein DedA with SNARE-associated domain
MRSASWPLIGLVIGAVGGWIWGWSASDYEAIDSAAGTAFLGALAGLLVGAVAYSLARRRKRDGG